MRDLRGDKVAGQERSSQGEQKHARLREQGKPLSRPHEQLLAGLINDSDRLKKTPQEGKRRCVKASVKAASKMRAVTLAQGGTEDSAVVASLPPYQSRHSRVIKLPAKYR